MEDEKFVFALDFDGGKFKAGVGKAAGDADKLTASLDKTSKAAQSSLGTAIPSAAAKAGQSTTNLSASAQRLADRIEAASAKSSRGFGQMRAAAKQTEGAFGSLGSMASRVTGTLALLGVGASAGAALRSVVVDAMELEKALGEVSSIVDTSTVDVRSMTAEVRSMAAAFGMEGVDATKALYQALSAGVPAAQAVQFLGVAATLAAGGVATLEESTDLLSSAINAYGLDVSQASEVSDVFFQTVKDGKTTIPELAKTIGQIAPLAKSAGVDLYELEAGMAALTSTGLSTSESTTQLKATIQAFLKPSAEARKVAQGLGFDLSGTNLAANGLHGAMQQLELVLDNAARQGIDTNEAVVQMFGSIEAAGAVLALTGSQSDKFTQSLENNKNAAGEAEKAAAKMAATSSGKLTAAWAVVAEAGSNVGQVILDIAAYMLDAVGGVDGLRKAMTVLGNYFTGGFKLISAVIKNGIGFWRMLFDSFKDYYTVFVSEFLKKIEQIRYGWAWVKNDIKEMEKASLAILKYEYESEAASLRSGSKLRAGVERQFEQTQSDLIDALITLGGGDNTASAAVKEEKKGLGIDRAAALARAQQAESLRMSQERIQQERLEQQSRSGSVSEGGSVRQRYQSEQLNHERQHSYDLAGIAYNTRDLVGRRFGLALEGGIDDAAPYLQSALSGVIESAAASVTFRDSSLAASTRYPTNTDVQSALFGSGLTGAQRVATISAMSRGLFGFAAGGSVPGVGTKDSVPAMLTPGEFVVTKEAARANYPALAAMNAGRDSEALFASPQGYGQEVTAPIQNATASPATRQARSVSRTTNNTVNVGGISVQGGSDKRRLVDAVVTEIQRRSKLGLMG